MLFNSYPFLLFFLPLSLALFYAALATRRDFLPAFALLAASVAFYAIWQVPYLWLLAASIAWNYGAGLAILRLRSRGNARGALAMLVVGVTADLAVLGYFKYSAFALENLRQLTGADWEVGKAILPLGISFYTFTQIAYLVDAKRGHASDASFTRYALFVTYFPHLVAGPILHHKEMIPQFSWQRFRRPEVARNIYLGTLIFILGLLKKTAVADPLSFFAKTGYEHAGVLNGIDGWITSLAYTFQLYFDFSGYSDMAVGLGLIMQIRLPINFSAPYLATSIQAFWRRWHVTLSSFLRDYLYIPLGGNRGGELATARNLFLTFLLGGLWHGAGWTFIAWGALHGAALVVHRYWPRARLPVPRWAGLAMTFLFVHVAWVYFRAESLGQAHDVLRAMSGLNHIGRRSELFSVQTIVDQFRIAGELPFLSTQVYALGSVALAAVVGVVFTCFDAHRVALRIRPGIAAGIVFALLTCFALLKLDRSVQFLYFNF